jgi:hypothetical protein
MGNGKKQHVCRKLRVIFCALTLVERNCAMSKHIGVPPRKLALVRRFDFSGVEMKSRSKPRRKPAGSAVVEYPPGFFTELMRRYDWPPGFRSRIGEEKA